jgi:hypothetical protein
MALALGKYSWAKGENCKCGRASFYSFNLHLMLSFKSKINVTIIQLSFE